MRSINETDASIVKGIATILWALNWANHADDHDCYNLSGCEITEHMPKIPDCVAEHARKVAESIERANGASLVTLLRMAAQADGVREYSEEYDAYVRDYAERFGECIAYMARGDGVSWYDDHERFGYILPSGDGVALPCDDAVEFKVPHYEDYDIRMHADDSCEESGNPKCQHCGAYARTHYRDPGKCHECGEDPGYPSED